MLGFEAFFTESVAYSNDEKERVRRVAINFFLDDKTILIKGNTHNHHHQKSKKAPLKKNLQIILEFLAEFY